MLELMSETVIKVENLTKFYQLGLINHGTLAKDLQGWWAKIRGKDDPNSQISLVNQQNRDKNTDFIYALKDVSFDVQQGEVLGIIGANGAGKSTLLKILSRVTSPTSGCIKIKGRIGSLLEVGTGFHPELTGRENIYLNGAILGMRKHEIDKKLDEIIDFSGVEKFIDTPVKRYSSGMYVKLAFSVAAHLDAEIMIMDEVLAVGDMAFQKKCIEKMNDVSRQLGRTILYVSHNMITIRQLCERAIVLDHGKIIFNGNVEDGIGIYLGKNSISGNIIDLKTREREPYFSHGNALMTKISLNSTNFKSDNNEKLVLSLDIQSKINADDVVVGVFLIYQGIAVTSMRSDPTITLKADKTQNIVFEVDLARLAPANYSIKLTLSRHNQLGNLEYLDVLSEICSFTIEQSLDFWNNLKWNPIYNGFLTGNKVHLISQGIIPNNDK